MNDILNAIGYDAALPLHVFALCTAWTFFIVTVIWVIGLFQGNHSLMDGYYGFGYAIPVWIAYCVTGAASATAAALLIMTSLHGCRLGYYLFHRWLGYRKTTGGDQRYLGFVQVLSPGYWWKSFFIVMEPQAIVIAVVGLPTVFGVLYTQQPTGPLSWLAFVGILVFGVGYYFETVADGQLAAFKADKANKGRYLRTGVWTHTRHPNYFGNTCVWWGIWIVAVAGSPEIWWTIAGPIVNTIMLTGILGKAFQDKYLGSRPEYQKVIEQTRGFLPLPKSKGT